MQRICPFLATDDDGRTVVDGFDARHRCRAEERSYPVGRTQQLTTCLQASHAACERYLAAIQSSGPAAWPPPATDASFVQTRLVLDVDQAVTGRGPSVAIGLPGRWVAGGLLAAAGVAAVASGVAGGLGLAARPAADTSPTPVAESTATPITPTIGPAIGGLSSAAPTSSPRPLPTATPTPTIEPTVSTAPQPRTYVVRSGDTLNGIAARFGTTVEALQEANGLSSSDVILVGQVLVIP